MADDAARQLFQTKANAWELLGERYWNSGYYGGPAAQHLDRFRQMIEPRTQTAVVGASTVSLSAAVQDKGGFLHLLDFAPSLLQAAAKWLSLDRDKCHLADVTEPIPDSLRNVFGLVLADRLITRFSAADLPKGTRGLRDLLAVGGRLAITTRFGLYPRDEEILASLTPNERTRFWQADVNEVDYGSLPDRSLPFPKWGEMSADMIAAHMRARGREVRPSRHQLLTLCTQLQLQCVEMLDASDGTTLLIFTRHRDLLGERNARLYE